MPFAPLGTNRPNFVLTQAVLPFNRKDLTPWDFANHFKLAFEGDGVRDVGNFLFDRELIKQKDLIRTGIGETLPSNARYTYRIVPGNKTSEWMATGARKDTYTTFIDCCLRIVVNQEVIDEVIAEWAGATQNWLNRLDELQFFLRGLDPGKGPVQVYDSWSPSFELGYTRDQAYRVARVQHTAWLDVLYRG